MVVGNCRRTISIWTLLVCCFSLTGLRNFHPVVEAESTDVMKLSAVSGGEASLPCDTLTPQPPDALLLVVWYKNDVPIYSYDGRVRGPSAHWADDALGGRARWHSNMPSTLRIRDVIAADRAMYRCRVDFKVTPTRNTKIQLDVIELPEKPKIFDEYDKEILGIAGPYEEGSDLKLTCVVSGGKPMPRLRWLRNDKVVKELAPIDDGSRLSVLELRISKLSREYLNALYTCTADNTNLVPSLRVNVQLQLYLRPLTVEILAREQPITVGQETEVACKSSGAKPPAVITWWLEGKQLVSAVEQKHSSDDNETVSILRWVPKMEQDRQVLTCRASHVLLQQSSIESTLALNLHYMPIVSLQLGSKLNPNDIEEGDDVYFECVVRANPPVYKVVWEHNGQQMTHNQRAGVIAGSAHLALQGVSKEQSGKYSCTASNVEGDGRSQMVHLQVIYKPVCKHQSPVIVGAAVNEAVKIVCEVDAYPMPSSFHWTLNNSKGSFDLDASKFTSDPNGKSVLTYLPSADVDYGSLACRSTNLAGQQIEACMYTMIPAVKPEAPYNCSAMNLTDDSVELRCMAGYDGGLRATYYVEAWSMGHLIVNASSVNPLWRLKSLGASRAVKIVFYAHNTRGRSDPVTLRIHTLSRLALQTEAKNYSLDIGWAVGIIGGMVGTFIAFACLALLVRKRKHRSMHYEGPIANAKCYKGTVHNGNRSPLQPDDKNPDVVPLGRDFNRSRESEPLPEPPPYGAAAPPLVGTSRSLHEIRNTPLTPALDTQSIGTIADDRRSVTSGTLSRRREVVTTRTPLLANTRESCV